MTPQIKGITEDSVKFYDVEREVGINIVEFSKLQFCPRVGDIVELPGEQREGAGTYDVIGVYHSFVEDEFEGGPFAKSLSVRIDVKKRRR